MRSNGHKNRCQRLIHDLRDRINVITGSSRNSAERSRASTGFTVLDELLTGGGLLRGTLVEWLGESEGSGAATLALKVAAQVLQPYGALVVIDAAGDFYAVAAAHLGIPLDRTIVVRPDSPADVLWAWEQSLRCHGVAVTLGRVDAASDRVLRRLQVGAETGGGLGFLLRSPDRRAGPSWASTRIRVRALPTPSCVYSLSRRWQLRLDRGLHGTRETVIEVELADEASHVHLVPQLADSTALYGTVGGSKQGGDPVLAGERRTPARGGVFPRSAQARRDARHAAG
jgi:hypothetical protein